MWSTLRNVLAIMVLLALAACVAAGGGNKAGGDKAAMNPITGDVIEVTELTSPPTAPDDGKLPVTAPATGGVDVLSDKARGKSQIAAEPTPVPRPELPAKGTADEVTAPEVADPVPEEQKSAAHVACEKKGDLWVKAGVSGASSCVKRTRDAGKHCSTGKQCEGDCLARSQTCAPYHPLFGCNDILQDDGVRMTLCLD